jgi:hypothetical protein
MPSHLPFFLAVAKATRIRFLVIQAPRESLYLPDTTTEKMITPKAVAGRNLRFFPLFWISRRLLSPKSNGIAPRDYHITL